MGDLSRDEPLMAFSCGDEASIEKVSLEGSGNSRPEELAAPTERGESPVEDGDMVWW